MKVELLKDAIAIIDGIPDDRLRLSRWQVQHSKVFDSELSLYHYKYISKARQIRCNTIACAGGWLCLHPDMQQRGLSINTHGGGYFEAFPKYKKKVGFEALGCFFGIDTGEAEELFGMRTSDEMDDEATRKLTDRQLWLHRAKLLLAKHKSDKFQ